MTRYTPRQKFPYPASADEYANAASQLEALAVATDAALDRVQASWVALRSPGRVVYKLTSDLNIAVGSGLTDFTPPFPSYTTVANSANAGGGSFPFSSGGVNASNYGWWDVSMHIATQPTGTANAGTRRYFQAQKLNLNNQAGADTVTYVWEDEETSSGGITAAELHMMLEVDAKTSGIFIAFLHANSSSSVNILAAGTYLECLQISGPVT